MDSTRLAPASIFGRVLTGLAAAAIIAAPAPAARAADDCTEGAPANQCLPGGGPSNTDCMMEWKISPQPQSSSSGIPRNRVSCTEGDSTCDVDTNLDDGVCKFRASWCINNTDARIPACYQSDVSTMEVEQPFYLSDAPVDRANIAAIQGAIGPGGIGPYVVQNGKLVYAGNVVSILNLCSPPIDLRVEMPRDARTGKYKKSRQKFTIRAAAGDGRIDTDNFMLYCVPSRCGDGKKQKGEECDDGNRLDGDGCSADCKFEGVPTPTPSPTPGPTTTPEPTTTPAPTPTPIPTPTPLPTPESLGGESPAGAPSAETQVQPAVALTATGDQIVAWVRGGKIVVQRFKDDGTALGSEIKPQVLGNDATGEFPDVAADATGNFAVCWSADDGVYEQAFDSSGATVGELKYVLTNLAPSHCAIASTSTGSRVLAYDGDTGVFAQRLDAANDSVGTPFEVASTGTRPDVVYLDAGRMAFAWRDGGVKARLFDAGSTAEGAAFDVAADDAVPSIAADEPGNFVVTWLSASLPKAQPFAKNGAADGSAFDVSSDPSATATGSTVRSAIDLAGNYAATWQTSAGVMGRYFDSSNPKVALGNNFQVNTGGVASDAAPAIGMDVAGNFAVVWAATADINLKRYTRGMFGVPANSYTGATADGGSVTTSAGATAADPIAVKVTTPAGGQVSVGTGPAQVTDPSGFQLLDFQVAVEAPAQTTADPLVLEFEVAAEAIPLGENAASLVVLKNGVPVNACAGAGANPDPCVAARSPLANGNVKITVRTSTASLWQVAKTFVATPTPTPVPTPTPTPEPTATPTPTPEPTATPTGAPATPTPTPAATATPVATGTPIGDWYFNVGTGASASCPTTATSQGSFLRGAGMPGSTSAGNGTGTPPVCSLSRGNFDNRYCSGNTDIACTSDANCSSVGAGTCSAGRFDVRAGGRDPGTGQAPVTLVAPRVLRVQQPSAASNDWICVRIESNGSGWVDCDGGTDSTVRALVNSNGAAAPPEPSWDDSWLSVGVDPTGDANTGQATLPVRAKLLTGPSLCVGPDNAAWDALPEIRSTLTTGFAHSIIQGAQKCPAAVGGLANCANVGNYTVPGTSNTNASTYQNLMGNHSTLECGNWTGQTAKFFQMPIFFLGQNFGSGTCDPTGGTANGSNCGDVAIIARVLANGTTAGP